MTLKDYFKSLINIFCLTIFIIDENNYSFSWGVM